MERQIDFSRFTRTAENSEVARQQQPQPQPRQPVFFQQKQEQENRSNWSGGIWAGRVDRSR